MKAKPKRKKEEDWIYDPIVIENILAAEKEVEETLKQGGHLPTLEELVETFQKEDAKKIRD